MISNSTNRGMCHSMSGLCQWKQSSNRRVMQNDVNALLVAFFCIKHDFLQRCRLLELYAIIIQRRLTSYSRYLTENLSVEKGNRVLLRNEGEGKPEPEHTEKFCRSLLRRIDAFACNLITLPFQISRIEFTNFCLFNFSSIFCIHFFN